ncbi:MAG: BMC domain-containing protein [Verrucomicrobiota bacterium]
MNAESLALGLVEVAFLSIAALVADTMVKGAAIRLDGFETTGNERLLIRVRGTVAEVVAALEAAERHAGSLGSRAVVRCLPHPDSQIEPLLSFPNAPNPLYGGQGPILPTDFPRSNDSAMNEHQLAIGILETQGLTAILEASDVMLKAANVTLVGKEKIGAAYVTVMIRGDVAAVQAAVDAGATAVGSLGKLIAAHVIPRPHPELLALLPK